MSSFPSLSFSGFNITQAGFILGPAFVVANGLAMFWPRYSLSDWCVAQVEQNLVSSVEAVPLFCILWVLITWLLTVVAYAFASAATRPGGIDNSDPRKQHKDSSMGWVYRLHCAHENTTECLVWFTACYVVADKSGRLDALLQAKWSVLVALSRTAYPFLYVSNVDALRTIVFAVGFFAALSMGLAAVFPDVMIPLVVESS